MNQYRYYINIGRYLVPSKYMYQFYKLLKPYTQFRFYFLLSLENFNNRVSFNNTDLT